MRCRVEGEPDADGRRPEAAHRGERAVDVGVHQQLRAGAQGRRGDGRGDGRQRPAAAQRGGGARRDRVYVLIGRGQLVLGIEGLKNELEFNI